MSRSLSVFLVVALLLALGGHQLYRHYFISAPTEAGRGYQVLVQVDQVREDEFLDTLEAIGTAAANEALEISSTVTATVESIHFSDGDRVERGDLLVQLEAGEQLGVVKEEQVRLQDAERQLEHYRKLARSKSIPKTQLDEQQAIVDARKAALKAAEGELHHYTLRAPFSGKLGVRRVSPGSLVKPGSIITTLDDLSVIKVDFTIPETFLQSVENGMRIICRTDAWPGQQFVGTVTHIDSRINPATRALAVRAELDNPEGHLRPGMLLTLELIKNRGQSLMVPEKALAPMKGEQFVFVIGDDNIAQRRTVTIGRRMPGKVEILSGLVAGETIVVEGGYRLQQGIPVKIAGTAQ